MISYYGGKQRIASWIASYCHSIPHTVYAEPFAGGLAVLYAKGIPEITNNNHYREVINDRNEELINLYRVARDHPAEFERWIQFTPYSQAEYKRACQIGRDPSSYSEMDRAWAYYVNLGQSFSNKAFAGWAKDLFSSNCAASWHGRRTGMTNALDRMAEVFIENKDALLCLKDFDSPQTLWYCDPPYPGTDLGHMGSYSLDDWAALCDALDNCQGSYILSGYQQPIEPKSYQIKTSRKANNHSSGKGKVRGDKTRKATAEEMGDRRRTEILWICDRSDGIRQELKPVIDRLFGGRDQNLAGIP